MNNFLAFIDEDIEAKKTLISTLPSKTKTDIRKYNEKINEITEKYEEYKKSVKKYIDTKSKSYNIKDNSKDLDELHDTVTNLEKVRFVLNPTNTYLEKMGFDNLLYQIGNYVDFNFKSLNEIINQFLDKFESSGVILTSNDFNYTCYVNEYMSSFFDVRSKKSDNYDEVSQIFEKIYWVNPDIIEHIELNFRKLIKKYEKVFTNYVLKLQKEIMTKNKIINYDDCLGKLKVVYTNFYNSDKETISDIINFAKSGAIDINNYFEESKSRISAYNSLAIDSLNFDDKELMDDFYGNLIKLKLNLEEYNNYIKFLPLIKDFKQEYEKQIPSDEKGSKNNSNKNLKNIESQIIDKEAKLEKMNKKIFSDRFGFFESKNDNSSKLLKIESVKLAKELYNLYKVYDQEYFKDKVISILNKSLTISELLHLYYSFDYFKKKVIKKVYGITSYEDIIKYSNDFDLFAMNPTNIVVNGMLLFEENDISKVIMNKYRLYNINLNEENLNPDDLITLIDKIQFLLRINEILKSSTTVEKIWFISQVEKINSKESKKE